MSSNEIKFTVNGQEYTVGNNVSSDVMLVDYLRNYLQLRGTKYNCREGGCGACIVTARKTSGAPYMAVNSCLTAIGLCHGWDILTIEGLGNRKDGYHTLQTTLAETHGTQCGYCTPGWVMNMHGLMQQNKECTMLDVEKGFGSNLCRCTGYRPIIQAFKKFAIDAPAEDQVKGLKQLSLRNSPKCCRKNDDEDEWCMVRADELRQNEMIQIELLDGKTWYRPSTLTQVLNLLEQDSSSYMLMAGNTAHGASPIEEYPNKIIDVSHLQELRANNFDQNLEVGGGITITEFIAIAKAASEQDSFKYLEKFVKHLDWVGHTPVRNTATIAGNLMIKNKSNANASDLWLLFEMVGAQLVISDYRGTRESVTMQNFLTLNMRAKVIISVLLPPLAGDEYLMYTYKLMPRAQSSHAIVNCALFFKIDLCTHEVEECKVIYGGLSAAFLRAPATESYLVGKSLFTNDTLQGALRVLDGEMVVVENPPEPSAQHRRYIAKALFYKGLLTLCPADIRGARYQSAIVELHNSRPVSTSKQTYDSDNTMWPINQSTAKLEGQIQCAGEAAFTDDMPTIINEVFAAFVLSTVGQGTIISIDPSPALALKGVIAFYTAKDIPGLNSFIPVDGGIFLADEEVLCEGKVHYHGQPIGIIVAETQYLANKASKLVTVRYSNVTKPVTSIKDARLINSRNALFSSIEATSTGTDVYKTMTGTTTMYGQYHSPMETLITVVKPTEEGIEVNLACQWLDGPHVAISRALNMDMHKIDVVIRRVGGSYGIKITRCIQSAVAASLVATKLNRPCRFIQPLTTNMKAVGKRMPNCYDYEVGVNSSGVIQFLNSSIYTDNGYIFCEPAIAYGTDVYYNSYKASPISLKAYNTVTDTPSNTFARAPGTMEQIACMETIMERISYELSLDPVDVRLANLDTSHSAEMIDMVAKLKAEIDYTARRAAVDSFNTENRFKKQGFRWCFATWKPLGGIYLDLNLAVYHEDGTVVITHGCVEMGQGINTKAVQIAAYLLKIPTSKIKIKVNDTTIAPNCFATAGSLTTEGVIISLRRAIEQLQARLEPIKATLDNPTWEELIATAFKNHVDLQVHGHVSNLDAQTYDIHGVCAVQTQLDCLTGEFQILRVDLLQDVGVSISPDLDVGQVEGGFMMTVGYWTCEKLVYNPENGENLTSRYWNYFLPEVRDTPQDFRVTLKTSHSNDVILGSKAVGEPSTCLGVCVAFAIREAMVEYRKESGIPSTTWFETDGPFNGEFICNNLHTKIEDFKYY